MSAYPGDRLVLEELAAVQVAVRQVLDQSPHADPVELLRGQTLTTLAGARYAVQDAALHDGTLALSVVPLTPSTLTITVTQAPTSATAADVRPPRPSDLASRIRPRPSRPQPWAPPVAIDSVRNRDGSWTATCSQHGRLIVWANREEARRAKVRHAFDVHGYALDAEGES